MCIRDSTTTATAIKTKSAGVAEVVDDSAEATAEQIEGLNEDPASFC